MKNKKRFIKSTLISLGLTVPLISIASTLVSCNSKKEENNTPPITPPVQLDENEYYLQNLEQFLSGPNNNTLTIPEGIQYISTKFDINDTQPPLEIIQKFQNVTDVIFPSTLNKLTFIVGHDNNLMMNLENIWWDKKGQYVPSKEPRFNNFEFVSKSTKLRNLFLPLRWPDRVMIIDKAIYNKDGLVDSLDKNEQYFNSIWTDYNQKEPIPNTVDVSLVSKSVLSTWVSSNNINNYLSSLKEYNFLTCQLYLSPVSSTKENPIMLSSSIWDNSEKPIPTYYAPLAIARSQVLNAGNLHVNFMENCQIRKFDMNKSFVWDDKRPGLDFYIRKNIFIDFSNCVDMTKQEYIDIWTHGINRDTPPGQTRPAGQLPRWTRAELLDKNDPHMIPPKHLAVECSNEKMCDLFQIK